MSNSMQNNYQVTGVRFLALFYAVRPRALSHRSPFPFQRSLLARTFPIVHHDDEALPVHIRNDRTCC